MTSPAPLVVGFDRDMTLVDPRAADEALAAVRRHGGKALVAGKSTRNAALLSEDGASVYVGDHVSDVEGALAAGVLSVSVLTGGCSEEALRGAGTQVVLSSLTDFPDWLDSRLLDLRLAALAQDLRARRSVMVAFSGGADSAFLLAAAVRALGSDNVVAATAYSDSLPQHERDPAHEFASGLGVRVLTPKTREMDRKGYRANAGDRCYFCKAELLDVLGPLATELGFEHVATGTNADDALAGFRPGIRAASERGAITPLRDAGFTKHQIRAASRMWGLATWHKAAAACLSSRVAFGIEVSPFRLSRIERAEVAVRSALDGAGLDVRNLRVRDLGEHASIEVDAELVASARTLPQVVAAAREAGFQHAEIDPSGFRSGSMNERLSEPDRYR
ncbi:MAG: HAD hydrolase-like protein [Actinomycetota bacterium]|nr:HAD hydrolase-like protein [Actinomycetota bacterium]